MINRSDDDVRTRQYIAKSTYIVCLLYKYSYFQPSGYFIRKFPSKKIIFLTGTFEFLFLINLSQKIEVCYYTKT